MILSEIEVKNYRVYEGEHDLKLAPPDQGKNVVLIGGLNGAGKTSLFSAVVLGLHGQNAAGLVFQRGHSDSLSKAYRRHLQESFSYGARARGENEMYIRLGLAHEGRMLSIHRMWWFDDEGRLDDESLVVYEDNKPLLIEAETEDERTQALQHHIEAFAPARVAKFFFFDGEEIRNIAARDPDQAVIEGLHQLLGFDALQRMVDDLEVLRGSIRRELPGASGAGLLTAVEEAEDLRQELTAHQAQLEATVGTLEEKRFELDRVESDLKELFEGRNIQSRSEALDALNERERELAALAAEIQAFVADTLTLTLPGKLLNQTARRARTEAKLRRAREARRRLAPLRDEFIEAVLGRDASKPTQPLSASQRRFMRRQMNVAWEDVVKGDPLDGDKILAHFTTEQLEQLPETAASARQTARRELLARLARRSHITAEIARLRRIHRAFDSEPRAQELLARKGSLLESILKEESRAKRLQQEIQRLEHERAAKLGVVGRMERQLRVADEIQVEIDVIERLCAATETFMGELRRGRLAALAAQTTEMMRLLAHKEDLVNRVEIDPASFSIRILDQHNEEVLDLSAGEREIFALSLVWGLARISRRVLPVMIDTPLGRLDQMHRENVVEQFLPRAGEQVIVLATDSEIDDRWYASLKQHIVQEVLIEFEDGTQRSALRADKYLDLRDSRKATA